MGSELRVRLPESMRLFLAAGRRGAEVRVAHDGTATLGHVVEALGVPLTEVGGLRAGGRSVAASYCPRGGEVIDVAAAPRPQPLPPHGFVLDVHLGALARRLRLLGVDAAYRNDRDDPALVEQANAQRRMLLTQDRGLLKRRGLRAGAYVRGAGPREQLDDVLDRFTPRLAPWTRCTACNGSLEKVGKEEIAERLEPGTLRTYDDFARCPDCGRVYWRGAHARRLEELVAHAADRVAARRGGAN